MVLSLIPIFNRSPYVNSKVVSTTVDPKPTQSLADPVEIILTHLKVSFTIFLFPFIKTRIVPQSINLILFYKETLVLVDFGVPFFCDKMKLAENSFILFLVVKYVWVIIRTANSFKLLQAFNSSFRFLFKLFGNLQPRDPYKGACNKKTCAQLLHLIIFRASII